MSKPRQSIKKQRHYFADKGPSSQSYDFSSGHVWMWELDHKEGWVLKNWCFWTVVLEKTLESPLDSKKIQPVHPKGNQPWISLEGLMLKLRAGWEGGSRGWDGWMTSPTRWTWVWVNSGSWWWTERPGVLRFMGSQRVGHDWVTELNWRGWKRLVAKFPSLFTFYLQVNSNAALILFHGF